MWNRELTEECQVAAFLLCSTHKTCCWVPWLHPPLSMCLWGPQGKLVTNTQGQGFPIGCWHPTWYVSHQAKVLWSKIVVGPCEISNLQDEFSPKVQRSHPKAEMGHSALLYWGLGWSGNRHLEKAWFLEYYTESFSLPPRPLLASWSFWETAEPSWPGTAYCTDIVVCPHVLYLA